MTVASSRVRTCAGDGWSLLTTFENMAWHLNQPQLHPETLTDLRSEPAFEKAVSATGYKNKTGKLAPQAPKSLSSILTVAVDSDGDLDDSDVVGFLRDGPLAGFA